MSETGLVRTRVVRRGGVLDLLLVTLVVVAVWAHTPVGNLMQRAVHTVLGHDVSNPSLTSYFRVERAWDRLVDHLAAEQLAVAPIVDPTAEGLPEPYRTAAHIVLADEAMLAELDAAYDGDPEATLERVAIGDEARERAIARARATGRVDPESYRAHRTYLPEELIETGDQAVDGVLAVATLLDLSWPVPEETRVSSGWGYRIHPLSGTRRFHNGLDLAIPVGTPVVAAQWGEVVVAAQDDRNGNYLVLEHGHGVRTAYCHLDKLHVAKGDRAMKGAIIADSGNSGRSTGPHLHFVVRVNGKTVDPLPLRRGKPES